VPRSGGGRRRTLILRLTWTCQAQPLRLPAVIAAVNWTALNVIAFTHESKIRPPPAYWPAVTVNSASGCGRRGRVNGHVLVDPVPA